MNKNDRLVCNLIIGGILQISFLLLFDHKIIKSLIAFFIVVGVMYLFTKVNYIPKE